MHVRLVAAVLALCAALAALYPVASPESTPVPVAAPTASETDPWTQEDFPIRVSTIEGGVRVEIKDYVDLECEACTDDEGILEAERIMSQVIAESLPVGEPLDVDEPMPAYVPAILLDNGWYGVPKDGCVCLYPPNFTRSITSG